MRQLQAVRFHGMRGPIVMKRLRSAKERIGRESEFAHLVAGEIDQAIIDGQLDLNQVNIFFIFEHITFQASWKSFDEFVSRGNVPWWGDKNKKHDPCPYWY